MHEEVDIMRVLSHTNIVRLIDSFGSHQYHYIIMELCPGGELYYQIAGLPPLNESLSRHIIVQLASALEYLHETLGIVHRFVAFHIQQTVRFGQSSDFSLRDIKLENILLCPMLLTQGEDVGNVKSNSSGEVPEKIKAGSPNDEPRRTRIGTVKLADFGLSKAVAGELMTPCGTAGYAAPELYDTQKYSTGVDMWALGCVLYTLLGGFPPFYDDDFRAMIKKVLRGNYSFTSPPWRHVSGAAKDLISNLLTVNPRERFTIRDFFSHPWIRQGLEENTPAVSTTQSDIVDPRQNLRVL